MFHLFSLYYFYASIHFCLLQNNLYFLYVIIIKTKVRRKCKPYMYIILSQLHDLKQYFSTEPPHAVECFDIDASREVGSADARGKLHTYRTLTLLWWMSSGQLGDAWSCPDPGNDQFFYVFLSYVCVNWERDRWEGCVEKILGDEYSNVTEVKLMYWGEGRRKHWETSTQT